MNNDEIKNNIAPISNPLPSPELNENQDDETVRFKDTPIQAVHTLEGDLFAAMKSEDYGNNIVKIVTNPNSNANAKFSKPSTDIETMGGDKKNVYKKYALYATIILLIILGLGVGILFYINSNSSTTPDNDISTTTIATSTPVLRKTAVVDPEVLKVLSIQKSNKYEFIKQINDTEAALRNSKLSANRTVGLTLDVDLPNFLSKLRYSGPDNLLRALDDDYSFGLYSNKTQAFEPYILMKINSFDLAFAGMLEWENSMPNDLQEMFAKEKLIGPASTEAASSGTSSAVTQIRSTTTITKPEIYIQKRFVDQVIKNIDTRVYTDNSLNLTIVYGFINKEYLLISGGPESFIDIRNKLLSKNILR